MTIRHGRDRERGQAVVELAIVSVVLLLLFATVLDFGRLFYTKITIENATRAGALVAAKAPTSYTGTDCTVVNSPNNKIGCAIQNEAHGSLVIASSDITVSCENVAGTTVACDPSGKPVLGLRSRVGITTQFGFYMPILAMVFGTNGIPVSADVAADQEFLPAARTDVPTPSVSIPPPSPSVVPSAGPSASVAPSPSASLAPCPLGQALLPDLVTGATGPGSTETVDEARTEWATAGFSPSNLSPQNGSTNKTVTGQYTDAAHTIALVPGACAPLVTATVYLTHS